MHARPSWMLNANPQRYCSAAASDDTGTILTCSHLIYSPEAAEEGSPSRRAPRSLGNCFSFQHRARCAPVLPLQESITRNSTELRDCTGTKLSPGACANGPDS